MQGTHYIHHNNTHLNRLTIHAVIKVTNYTLSRYKLLFLITELKIKRDSYVYTLFTLKFGFRFLIKFQDMLDFNDKTHYPIFL